MNTFKLRLFRVDTDFFLSECVTEAERKAGAALALYHELGGCSPKLLDLANHYAKLAVRIQEWWRE